MRIKVCGNTQLSQVHELDVMGIEFAGFIFYSKSPRYIIGRIGEKNLKNTKLAIKKVGVFVNADYEEVMHQVKQFGLQMVQLHGDESPMLCERIYTQIPVIKVFRIKEDDHELTSRIKDYSSICSYYLFDTDTGGYGGSGEKFNWRLLEKAVIDKPFFLSGGIGVDDKADLDHFLADRPGRDIFGIDVNSKVEISPGVKDMEKLKRLIEGWR